MLTVQYAFGSLGPRLDLKRMNPTLIYVHIPKTAGTTLYSILKKNFERARIFFSHSAADLASLPAEERVRLQLIRGHFPYGIHRCLSQPFEYITILRDPIERTISNYYYVLRSPDHHLHNRLVTQKIGLKEYVIESSNKQLDNGQTRMISGDGFQAPFGRCGRELLEQAKHNLQHSFSVVGLTERFDETVLLMARRFGWKRTHYVRRNTTEKRLPGEQLDPEILEAVRALNALDLELYAFATTLFERAVSEQFLFNWKLAGYRAGNRLRTALRVQSRA
jgi:hypothetical protein